MSAATLKLCPVCRRHFPTRMAFHTCHRCRADFKRKCRLAGVRT